MLPSRAGLLLVLLLVQAGSLQQSSSSFKPPARQPSRPGCPTPGGPALPLAQSRSIECELRSNEEHIYRIALAAGDFLAAQVMQDGIDVCLEILAPSDRTLLLMDSPNGRKGEERIHFVAGVSGSYKLTLSGESGARRGRYQLFSGKAHPATMAEKASAAAFRSLAMGDSLKHQDRMGDAVEKYRSALGIWKVLEDTRNQILALERLGNLFELWSRYRDALAAFRPGLLLARTSGDRAAEARLSIRSALMLQKLGDVREAQDLYEKALGIAEKNGYLQEQAEVHNNRALVLKALGKVQEVLASYTISEKLLQTLREPAQLAQVLCNRGEFLLAMGQPEAALKFFQRAMDQLDLEEERNVRSAVLNGAGLAYQELGLPRKALWSYHLALRLAEDPSERAFILSRLATVLLHEGRLPQAEIALRETLDLARSLHEVQRVAFTLADLAHLQNLLAREEQAMRLFEEALEIVTELKDPVAKASVLFGLAETQRNLGHLHDAVRSIETSIALVESQRSVLESESRVSFFAARHRYYELYIDLLMELHLRDPRAGYALRAFRASEQSRGRSLLDDVIGGPAAAGMSVDEIRRNVLDPDSVLLVYALGDRRSFLWVVTPAALEAHVLPKRTEVEDTALEVWRNMSKGSAGKDVRVLSSILFPRAIEPLAGKRLLISPDGALHLVPFSALCDPGLLKACESRAPRPLAMDHEIVVVPSASVIGGMRHKLEARKPAPNLLAIAADPVFRRDDQRFERLGPSPNGETEEDLPGGPLQRLLYTSTEAEEILKLVSSGSTIRALGFQANREVASSPEFLASRILHIATHNLPEGHPDFSGLVFSRYDEAGHRREGFLPAREIYGLRVPAELVVLSACGTGLGRNIRGEGPMGLTRAFLHAGARRVVVSLWNVQEEETAVLMSRFYRGMLRDRLSPAAALRAAQRSMALDHYLPRAWAGFELQGEPR